MTLTLPNKMTEIPPLPQGGTPFTKSDWDLISDLSGASPPDWFTELTCTNPIGGLEFMFAEGVVTDDRIESCLLYSPKYFPDIIKHHYLWSRTSDCAHLATNWFPIGDAEDSSYWVVPSDGSPSGPIYLFVDYRFAGGRLTIGNGVGEVFPDFSTFVESATSIRPIEDEAMTLGYPPNG